MLWLLGSTGECGLVLVGSGKEPWARCRQMERESDKEAEQEQEGLSRGQPGSRQGAGRGAGTGIPGSSVMVAIKISLLFFCFSSFRGFFFFPPSGGKCHIAEQVEDLFVCIFWGAGKDTSNQTPS